MERRHFISKLGMGAAVAALRPDAVERIWAASQSRTNLSPEAVARDEDFWFQVRHAFTIDRNQINLNSGSVSPAPRVVQEAMKQYLTIVHMSPSLWVDEMLIPQQEALRERLAGPFGCDPEEMVITRNTSEALQIVQFGLKLQPGDEVLTTTQDYPRMLTTWRQRERRDGIVLKTFRIPTPPDSLDVLYDLFERAVTPRTRVIHFCHITYTAGQIFPVKKICRHRMCLRRWPKSMPSRTLSNRSPITGSSRVRRSRRRSGGAWRRRPSAKASLWWSRPLKGAHVEETAFVYCRHAASISINQGGQAMNWIHRWMMSVLISLLLGNLAFAQQGITQYV